MPATEKAFAVMWKDVDFWEVRSLRLKSTNKVHWPTVALGELCKVRSEIIPAEDALSNTIDLLDRISFDEGKVHAGKREQTRMIQFRARPGDVVVSKINARKRAIGIVPDGNDVGITIHFRALVPNNEIIDTRFLWMALRSTYCTNQFDIATGGIGKGEISEQNLLAVHVPLPPLNVQRAIVEQWQTAQDEIAAEVERLTFNERVVAHKIYNALRTPIAKDAAIMPKAFALHWKDMERWSVGYIQHAMKGVLGFTQSQYPIVPLSECLTGTMNGKSILPVSHETPYRVLKLSALTTEGLDISASKYAVVDEPNAERFTLRKNDLLICRSNAYEYVGKAALVENDEPRILFPDIIIRARFNDKVLPAYVCEIIQTPLGRSFFQVNSRRAVGGMWKISADDIKNFPIPLPPLSVQHDIVERVGTMRDQIRTARAALHQKAAAVKQHTEEMIAGTRPVSTISAA